MLIKSVHNLEVRVVLKTESANTGTIAAAKGNSLLKAFCAEVRFLRASRPRVHSREVLDEPQSISQETLGLGPEKTVRPTRVVS